MESILEKIKKEIFKPEMKIWEKIISVITFVFDCLYRVLLEFSKVVLLVIVIVVSAQVFARFFSKSIMWSEEVALLLMVWTAFIAMAIGVEKNLHIAITIFYGMFPKIVQKILYKLILCAIIFFGVLLIVFGCPLVANGMRNLMPATQWPNGIKFLMMPVSGVFIIYFAALDLLELNRFRHLNVEDGDRGDTKTDQQIVDEMRASKSEAAATENAAESAESAEPKEDK